MARGFLNNELCVLTTLCQILPNVLDSNKAPIFFYSDVFIFFCDIIRRVQSVAAGVVVDCEFK